MIKRIEKVELDPTESNTKAIIELITKVNEIIGILNPNELEKETPVFIHETQMTFDDVSESKNV